MSKGERWEEVGLAHSALADIWFNGAAEAAYVNLRCLEAVGK